jgi:transcription initiation factor IIE alpha subunit
MGNKNTALKGIINNEVQQVLCPTCGTALVYVDEIADLKHRSWADNRAKENANRLERIKKERPDLIYSKI